MQYQSLEDSPLSVGEFGPHTWALSLDGQVGPDEVPRLAHLLALRAPEGTDLMLWDETDDDPRVAIATAAGWRRFSGKVFVDGDLDDVGEVRIPDGWVLETYAELGEEEFAARMLAAAAGDPSSPSTPETAVADLRELVAFAGDAFDPQAWFAIRDAAPIGVLLPQPYPEDPLEGTIFYLGVVPERRGEGLGHRLYELGRQMLRERGVVRQVDSSEERNLPMLKVFALAGMRVVRSQGFFRRPQRVR